MSHHDFYIALAYGLSALLLLAEVVSLCLRWRRVRRQMGEESL